MWTTPLWPVMLSSALWDAKDFHRPGADSIRVRSSGLSVCSNSFLFINLHKQVKGQKTPKTLTHRCLPVDTKTWRMEDTAVDSDDLRPAATPSCQRWTGRWQSVLSHSLDPGSLWAAHKAARLQRRGWWWRLGQTERRTWINGGQSVDTYTFERFL